jgi:ABC-type phosphate/phosphonate transport system permease subunit
MTNNKVKKTALDRKLDKIRAAEESGKLGTKLTNRTLRKLTSNKLAVIGVALFVVICVLCFGAPLFTKYAPTALDLRAKMSPPDLKHILGTDQMGRDMFCRILYGTKYSFTIGLIAATGSALIGIPIGAVCGYYGGKLDDIVMRLLDIFGSIPSVLLGCLVVQALGASMFNLIIAIALTGITGNIAMLCRRNWAQYFCFASAVLTLLSYGVLVWQTLLFFKGGPPLVFIITMIAVTIFIMIRIALQVFDLISIFKARHFFLERDGY